MNVNIHTNGVFTENTILLIILLKHLAIYNGSITGHATIIPNTDKYTAWLDGQLELSIVDHSVDQNDRKAKSINVRP